MLAKAIKAVVRETFPQSFQRSQEALTRYRLNRVTRLLARRHGLVVQSGPFKGMKYVSHAICSSLAPKLLGSYEAELHEALTQIIGADYETVIDIGCAEGYYAVGLALQLPNARMFAFDIDSRARELCKALARTNDVSERVSVEGECGYERLQTLTSSRALVVCDCEGCELGLLDPSLIPGLRTSDLLVELHDMVDPSISKTIVERFAPTHEITLIDSADRNPSLFPALKDFSPATQRTAVAEFRGEMMQWAYMRARAFAD